MLTETLRRKMLKIQFRDDGKIEAGVDEVGRGCLWGPLVTGAVIWPAESSWTEKLRELAPQIKDSKKISEKKRKVIATKINELALATGIGVVEASDIDAIGITKANQTAFARAVTNLKVKPGRLLVDGTIPLLYDDWKDEQYSIVDGDAEYLPIAAASIIAKVYRDTWVEEWCSQNKPLGEDYSLVSSKGYGTAAHRRAIQEKGILPLHRRLFLRKMFGEQIYKPSHQCFIEDDN